MISSKVCVDCGVKHLTEEQEKKGSNRTFTLNRCIVCKEIKHVTSTRHYNYLNKTI